jgi:DNA polymerase-3 subunit epsilon
VNIRDLGSFERFYFRRDDEAPNPYALRVNGLYDGVISEKRGDADYPRLFNDDTGFKDFAAGVDRFVGHNIAFDRQYVNFPMKHRFCTMTTNGPVMGLKRRNGAPKWPSLAEAAAFYRVPLQKGALHGSSYDTAVTYRIFTEMLLWEITAPKVRNFLWGK